MSTSFRPVNEVWGEPSSCFVNGDLMLWVLLTIDFDYWLLSSHAGVEVELKELSSEAIGELVYQRSLQLNPCETAGT